MDLGWGIMVWENLQLVLLKDKVFLLFIIKKKSIFDIKTYPNKSLALKNKGFIFRSDSNTEDLEGFAGAGLFDSIPMVDYEEVKMEYGINKIFWVENWLGELMKEIVDLGIEVEKIQGDHRILKEILIIQNSILFTRDHKYNDLCKNIIIYSFDDCSFIINKFFPFLNINI